MAEPVEKLEKGWPVIKKAPWHFSSAVMILVCLAWAAIHWHYTVVIQAKDSTIQSKDALIESKEATIRAKEQSVNSIKQIVTAKDELIISLTNQFYSMLAFQAQLATSQSNLLIAQTNIEAQAKKIEDVEFLVQNLFSKTVNETLSGADTNRVLIVNDWGDVKRVAFKLEFAAFPNSIHGIMKTSGLIGQIPLIPIRWNYRNIFMTTFRDVNLKDATFEIQYVRETNETNLIKTIEMRGTNIICFDGDCKIIP